MSKIVPTIEAQVSGDRGDIEGLRNYLRELANEGITVSDDLRSSMFPTQGSVPIESLTIVITGHLVAMMSHELIKALVVELISRSKARKQLNIDKISPAKKPNN